jgi:hypothetical protein
MQILMKNNFFSPDFDFNNPTMKYNIGDGEVFMWEAQPE